MFGGDRIATEKKKNPVSETQKLKTPTKSHFISVEKCLSINVKICSSVVSQHISVKNLLISSTCADSEKESNKPNNRFD